MTAFTEMLASGYGTDEPSLVLGAALEGSQVHQEPKIRLPLAMANRHGLVAGATGTGKTRTLQLLTEQLSAQGVPVFVADMKGDLSGLAMPGEASRPSERPLGRHRVGLEAERRAGGVREPDGWLGGAAPRYGELVRAAAAGQSALVERHPDQRPHHGLQVRGRQSGFHLLDFTDLRAVLQFLGSEEGKTALAQYGGMSSASVGVLLRKMVELESQGAERFFGEPEFDVKDMLQTTSDGRGVVTCLELPDVADKPKLFSTFMMWMLAELYHNLPEAGDLPKPKLVFFFDEAHLLFDDAPKAFLDQIEQVVRLIRSKGVGVYFVTQTPKDVPEGVLAQLGNRIQHALRAHTPDDDKALKATVRTFPKTSFYDLEETLTSLGIGEAVVTVLNARGSPTPVVATRLIPPCVANGAAHAGGAAGGYPAVGLAGGIREGSRPGERAGDAGGPDGNDDACGGEAGQPALRLADRTRPWARWRLGCCILADRAERWCGRWCAESFGLLGAKPPRSTSTRRRRW